MYRALDLSAVVQEIGSGTDVEKVLLPLPAYIQKDLSPEANICSLAAITRVAHYHALQRGATPLVTSYYATVRRLAQAHWFFSRFGTPPTRIDDLARDAFRALGMPADVHSRYFIGKRHLITSELEAGRPLLLSTTFGPYRSHTTTLCGYRRAGERLYIALIDGWRRSVRYIDYHALVRSTPFSLTIIRPHHLKGVRPWPTSPHSS